MISIVVSELLILLLLLLGIMRLLGVGQGSLLLHVLLHGGADWAAGALALLMMLQQVARGQAPAKAVSPPYKPLTGRTDEVSLRGKALVKGLHGISTSWQVIQDMYPTARPFCNIWHEHGLIV